MEITRSNKHTYGQHSYSCSHLKMLLSQFNQSVKNVTGDVTDLACWLIVKLIRKVLSILNHYSFTACLLTDHFTRLLMFILILGTLGISFSAGHIQTLYQQTQGKLSVPFLSIYHCRIKFVTLNHF